MVRIALPRYRALGRKKGCRAGVRWAMVRSLMSGSGNDIQALATAVRSGDRRALSRAITLVESGRGDHREQADVLLDGLVAGPASNSVRIGITGSPGVGKSTFIEAFGAHVTERGHRLAVLAIDPSSSRTGGSILGDKTRMPKLSRNPAAYIRPSPSGAGLGGVARRTRDVITVVEAAGFDVVLVETVGVGQSEFKVAELVDLFMLLLAPGGGDELQGIKRGIMELADLVVINKADGELKNAARHAASDYRSALTLMRPKHEAWKAEVLTVSSLTADGMDTVWDAVSRYRQALGQDGSFSGQRAGQAVRWMWQEIEAALLSRMRDRPGLDALLHELEGKVARGVLSPNAAANQVLERFLSPN